jgi:hypothetical protein
MYELTLAIHNLLRWAVVLTGLAVVVRAAGGLSSKRDWTDQGHARWFSLSMNLQFLVGLRYCGSARCGQPGRHGLGDEGRGAAVLGIEHVTMMMLALGLAHGGRA